MRLRTSTPRRVAAAGIAVATAAALAACSSDSGENPDTGATGGSETSVEVSDETPTTPLDQVLLAKGEAPGNGVVDKLDPAALKAAVDQLVKDQGRKLMDDPACDKVSRLETTNNYAASEAVMSAVRYKQAEDNDTEHRFGVVLLGKKLDEFLDRSLYEACTTSKSATNPDMQLTMKVSDAPEVPGAEGFRVTSDFVTTTPEGRKVLNRTIVVHGYAHGTTTAVEYNALSEDAAKDPVLPEADAAINAIYTAQMDKLVKAE